MLEQRYQQLVRRAAGETRACCQCQQPTDRWEYWSMEKAQRGTDMRVICAPCFQKLISATKRALAAVPEEQRD